MWAAGMNQASTIKRNTEPSTRRITLDHRDDDFQSGGVLEDGKWNRPAYIHNNIRRSGLCWRCQSAKHKATNTVGEGGNVPFSLPDTALRRNEGIDS